MFGFQIIPIDSDFSIPTMTTSTIILKFPTYSDAITTTKKIHFRASNKSTAIWWGYPKKSLHIQILSTKNPIRYSMYRKSYHI